MHCESDLLHESLGAAVRREALTVGEGRCAMHPRKDAAHSCERCGSFACDVCATQTGGSVYCPDCFSTLHERAELATVATSRTRPDGWCLALALVGPILFCTTTVIAFFWSIWLLLTLSKRPWIRVSTVVMALLVSGAQLAFFVALFGASAFAS